MDTLRNTPSTAALAAEMPNLVPQQTIKKPCFDKVRNDFIPHPHAFPIEIRRLRPKRRDPYALYEPPVSGDLGLRFTIDKYLPSGSEIEIAIPLRGETQRFNGTVVLVRETAGGWELGVWLATPDDASRARLVEQICHLESKLEPEPQVSPKKQRTTSTNFFSQLPRLTQWVAGY